MVSEQVGLSGQVVQLCLFPSMRHVCKNIVDSCFVFYLHVRNETSGGEAYASLECSNCRELGHHVAACEGAVLASSTVLRIL